VEPEGAEADFSGWFREGSGGVPQNAPAPAHGGYGPDPDSGLTHSPSASNGHAAAFATGDILPAGDGYLPTAESLPPKLFPPADRGYQLAGGTPDELDTSRLYGQIAIYTLLDGRVDDFDALAERVVEQVKSAEPGTLVYVMHAVPSAPMQRILYQVYRDGAAFDEHARQPYVQRFEEERKPCVLATNVIELGVRHAKFAAAIPGQRPLPGEARPWSNGAR
jgi:quinol monooxygenase YgiN